MPTTDSPGAPSRVWSALPARSICADQSAARASSYWRAQMRLSELNGDGGRLIASNSGDWLLDQRPVPKSSLFSG